MGALIATLSRSSWLSFASAFMLLVGLMLLHPGLRRRSLMAGIIAGLALAIAVTPFAGKIIARITDSRTDAMLGRAEYKRDAKAMISVKPWLGWGLNSYVFAVPQFTRYGAREVNRWYGNWIPPVHHIYYLWWAETGLIGLAVHLTMWGSIIWVGVRNLRVRHQLLFAINAACLSAMLAFIVDGFFSFTLRVNATLRVFWILAAIIMAVHYWCLEHPENQTHTGSLPGGASPVA
jgi:O-antigen ligase